MRRRRQRRPGVRLRRALVALGEEPERVDLLDEVGHAGPAAEAEADHQHPRHHERVQHEHPRPARQKRRRLLRCILLHRIQESDHEKLASTRPAKTTTNFS